MISAQLRQLVRERAGRRCEFCHFHEEHLPLWPFHLDHIVAKQHGGTDDDANLAWSCHRCNLHKGTNLSAIDPDSATAMPLFNPRTQNWVEHFTFRAGRVVGLSAIGRATAWLLEMSSAERVELRRVLKGEFT